MYIFVSTNQTNTIDMKIADLSKPHIYVDGVAVNTEVAKNAHELLQTLIHVSACLEYGDNPIHLKKDIENAIKKATS